MCGDLDGWCGQSLGQEYIEDMSTHTSNAVFIVMWPIFNILLVNLLVAGAPLIPPPNHLQSTPVENISPRACRNSCYIQMCLMGKVVISKDSHKKRLKWV